MKMKKISFKSYFVGCARRDEDALVKGQEVIFSAVLHFNPQPRSLFTLQENAKKL
jgi:hypothetical protein